MNICGWMQEPNNKMWKGLSSEVLRLMKCEDLHVYWTLKKDLVFLDSNKTLISLIPQDQKQSKVS